MEIEYFGCIVVLVIANLYIMYGFEQGYTAGW